MMKSFLTAIGLLAGSAGAAAQDTVNVICPVQAEWCNAVATVYARETGAKLDITQKGSGETAVSISFVHDGAGEKMQRFPLETVTPADGTGAEIGSTSIVEGARNLDAAKRFYERALTPAAQNKQFRLPGNPKAELDARVPDFKNIRFIDYGYAKYTRNTAAAPAPGRAPGKGRGLAAALKHEAHPPSFARPAPRLSLSP